MTELRLPILLVVFLFLCSSRAYSQSCDCPPINTCGPCEGGLTSLTLRYDAALGLPAAITVSDAGGIIFTGTVNDGAEFSFISSLGADQPFAGDIVTITADILTTVEIYTSCNTPVYVGDVYDPYTVTAGVSMSGLPICCSAENMEINPPVISNCPADITVILSDTECSAVVSWTEPTATDDCGISSFTSNYSPGDTFASGTTEVIYTAIDDYGNTSTCSFNVILEDNHFPVISGCPGDMNLNNSPDTSCGTIATWTEPTVSDACAVTLTSTHNSGDFFPRGKTTVTYTATDASGNITTCSFNVIANDATKPIISGCPTSDILVTTDGSCEAIATWDEITATDNCEYVTITSTHKSGDTFPLGKTKVTFTATDSTGNSSKCSFNIIVSETTPPVISGCPADIVATADASCSAVISWTEPTVTDNCSSTLTSTHTPGATFPIGTTTVTYTATDASGNTATCSFNVTVNDETPPVISECPADLILTADNSCSAVASWTSPTATDNCVTVNISSTHNSGDPFPIGITTVTYTATDASGNTATCSFDVTVNDETAPVFSGCPADIIATADASCEASVSWTEPTAPDNCNTISLTSSHNSGADFPRGKTTVTYTATDESGNVSTCSFTVTVNDETDPVISGCPADITATADASCEASVNWTPPTATDNCNVTIISTHNSGAVFSFGTTKVTYTATDAAGNSTTCSFNVTVIDETAPIISGCPADITATADASCEAVVSWTPPTASDNCSSTISIASSHNPGDDFELGTTTVTYTATDGTGNKTTCSFNVTVTDETAPVFLECPADITATADASCEASVTWTAPNATDNCGTANITSSHNPGATFTSGTTMVTYTATDASGNTATCSFNVTVTDQAAPVFSGCPSDITATADASCEASVNWTEPTSTDNCGTANITTSHSPGATFPSGTTTVTYTATDASGNTSTCSFNVTVTDEAAPVFSGCPADITATTDASCEASVTWTAPTANTSCGTVNVTSSHNPGDAFPLGTTTVTYTAKNAAGNSSTCSFDVTVTDETAPVFSGCPSDIVVTNNSSCEASANWTAPTVSDDCGDVNISGSHNPGDNFPVGRTEVTYTATDEKGNTALCQFNVIIKNESLPVISGCPEDINVKAGASRQVMVEWPRPKAEVICGTVNFTGTHEPGDLFPIGTTVVEYEATDHFGNTSLCTFSVTVAYEEVEFEIAPVITPNGDGYNDEWILNHIEKFRDNKVIIIDRWGSEIFSAAGYNNENVVWNGTNKNGALVPTGTYYYFISVRFASTVVEKRGFIELVR